MRKTMMCLALAAVAGLGAWAARTSVADDHSNSSQAAATVAKVGEMAPEFSLTDQDGKSVTLSDFKGKVVVLEWFNDECPFVKKFYNQGHMNKWAAKAKEKGVVWLTIDSTSFHDVAHAKSTAGTMKLDRPLLTDADGKVGHAYGATNTPNMYVIDTAGKLVYAGAIDSVKSSDTSDIDGATNYVNAALDEVLAGKPVTTASSKPYGCSIKYKS